MLVVFCALVKLYNVTVRAAFTRAIEEARATAQYKHLTGQFVFSEERDFLFHNKLRK